MKKDLMHMYNNNLDGLVYMLAELYHERSLLRLHWLCEKYPEEMRRAMVEYWHDHSDKMPSLAQVVEIAENYLSRVKKKSEEYSATWPW